MDGIGMSTRVASETPKRNAPALSSPSPPRGTVTDDLVAVLVARDSKVVCRWHRWMGGRFGYSRCQQDQKGHRSANRGNDLQRNSAHS